MLGLPDTISACLFDLDGVLTKTAVVHARAWKEEFDGFLRELGEPPFELPREYDEHVDGKPRLDGVRSFLQARGIEADEKLVRTLADRKNELVLAMMAKDGVDAYEGSVRYVEAARAAGLRRAVSTRRRPTRSSSRTRWPASKRAATAASATSSASTAAARRKPSRSAAPTLS